MLVQTQNRNTNESTESLLKKAGYIHQVSSGSYILLELGQRVVNKINYIIRQQLEIAGIGEISINQLQLQDSWQDTGRLETYGNELYQLTDRKGKKLLLSPTNEEMVTNLAKSTISSYRHLSKTVFTINNKFRDELRASNGLIRTKEFLMMDAYSFDETYQDLDNSYQNMREIFINILNQVGVQYRIESSNTGEVGGSYSEEFIATTSFGDIEIAHIFKLDDKYSNLLDAKFVGQDGMRHNLMMGCYGIGVTRLLQVIADQFRTATGLGWSNTTSAFDMAIIVVDINNEIHQQKILSIINENFDKTILIDDRDISIGKKINDIELMGINYLIAGNN